MINTMINPQRSLGGHMYIHHSYKISYNLHYILKSDFVYEYNLYYCMRIYINSHDCVVKYFCINYQNRKQYCIYKNVARNEFCEPKDQS